MTDDGFAWTVLGRDNQGWHASVYEIIVYPFRSKGNKQVEWNRRILMSCTTEVMCGCNGGTN